MKRLVSVLLILSLVLSLCVAGAAAESVKYKVTVTASCSNYNHVGNDWSKAFTLNGKTITSGSTFTTSTGSSITCGAKITQNDKVPDIGTGSKSYVVKNGKAFSVSFNVSVKENKGRYAGCVATWKVKFQFKPVK